MNRLFFYLAGCSMLFGDVIFMVAFFMMSWVQLEGLDEEDVSHLTSTEYGLWRTCVKDNLTHKTSCSGISLSKAGNYNGQIKSFHDNDIE